MLAGADSNQGPSAQVCSLCGQGCPGGRCPMKERARPFVLAGRSLRGKPELCPEWGTLEVACRRPRRDPSPDLSRLHPAPSSSALASPHHPCLLSWSSTSTSQPLGPPPVKYGHLRSPRDTATHPPSTYHLHSQACPSLVPLFDWGHFYYSQQPGLKGETHSNLHPTSCPQPQEHQGLTLLQIPCAGHPRPLPSRDLTATVFLLLSRAPKLGCGPSASPGVPVAGAGIGTLLSSWRFRRTGSTLHCRVI